ncbi:MAG: LysR family transcriptional regulator [Ruminococcus sp.]|nr:LysR family transcriptional regulator [Ruminococcus sp.]
MELRVLQYFLAVAREESFTGAANALHLSQPTLSRQLKDLEMELGKQLFIRGSKKIELTDEGRILKKRAEEIVSLVNKTENEIAVSDDHIAGDVFIGAGETVGVHYLTKAAKRVRNDYPDIHFHIISGDRSDVVERLDNGLVDFGLVFGSIDDTKYESINIPNSDVWGVLMRKDSPLAEKEMIEPKDLYDKPLIVSRQADKTGIVKRLLHRSADKLNIIATYNLIFNGTLMVQDGLGYALCLESVHQPDRNRELIFKPLSTAVSEELHIVWKKDNVFSKASQRFLYEISKSAKSSRISYECL